MYRTPSSRFVRTRQRNAINSRRAKSSRKRFAAFSHLVAVFNRVSPSIRTLIYIHARIHTYTRTHARTRARHAHVHTPCKLMVQVVLLPLSSTTTLVAAAMFESRMRCRPVARRGQPLSDALELVPTRARVANPVLVRATPRGGRVNRVE